MTNTTNTIDTRCADCGTTMGFDELEARECASCETAIDHGSLEIIEDNCLDCGEEMAYLMDVSNPLHTHNQNFILCDDCGTCCL